jgi:6-pyruvoyltetrahydropterin/6-carboxytetrahydropterin synthase
MDFGGLKAFKEWLEYMFDHTTLIAQDDPHLDKFVDLAKLGLNDQGGILDLRVVPGVGCEKFSELAFNNMKAILDAYKNGSSYTLPNGKTFESRYPVGQDVKLKSVEVFEHEANSAIYEG